MSERGRRRRPRFLVSCTAFQRSGIGGGGTRRNLKIGGDDKRWLVRRKSQRRDARRNPVRKAARSKARWNSLRFPFCVSFLEYERGRRRRPRFLVSPPP